ncbi:MAG: hypothetical protein OEM91_00100 [Hyphomicrobiales bacterium]|nr:hypothetical protein [Hyphomicrobiales bacterium]
MFARSIAVLGATIVGGGVASTAAEAFGRHHGCCQTTACYQKVVSAPVYKTVMTKVMVQPARCTNVQTPPVYGTQPQRVVLEPARQYTRSAPPVYGRVRVTEMVHPGHTKWKHKRGCCGVEYKCAVTVAPKYRTTSRRVQVRPASAWIETKPAVTGIVHRQVVISPGSVRKVCHPAVYKTVAKQVLVSAGTEQWVPAAHGGSCRR